MEKMKSVADKKPRSFAILLLLLVVVVVVVVVVVLVQGSNPGGVRFSARPNRAWGPPSPLYNGYRVFPGG